MRDSFDPARGGRGGCRGDGWGGARTADHLVEMVGALEQLDDDALHPQVVAPDRLDQLGVVRALDEDAAGPGHAGRRPGHGDRARRGAATAATLAAFGGTRVTWLPCTVKLASRSWAAQYRPSGPRRTTAPLATDTTVPRRPEPRCSASSPGTASTFGYAFGRRRGSSSRSRGSERMPLR